MVACCVLHHTFSPYPHLPTFPFPNTLQSLLNPKTRVWIFMETFEMLAGGTDSQRNRGSFYTQGNWQMTGSKALLDGQVRGYAIST